MSSLEKGVSTSLYEKVKIKTTPTVLPGASTKHGLVSRGANGIRTGQGSTNYDPHLLGVTRMGNMQWKDFEKEIAQREEIRKGLRQVRESFASPFDNPIPTYSSDTTSMGQLVTAADQAINSLQQEQEMQLLNPPIISPNVNNFTAATFRTTRSGKKGIPLTTPMPSLDNKQTRGAMSPTETIALVAAAAAQAALQASPYHGQMELTDKGAFTTIATAAATAAASAYLGKHVAQNPVTTGRSNLNRHGATNNPVTVADSIGNAMPSQLLSQQNYGNNPSEQQSLVGGKTFYTNNENHNISFVKSLSSSRSSGLESVRRRRRGAGHSFSKDGGSTHSDLASSNANSTYSRLAIRSNSKLDIVPSPSNKNEKALLMNGSTPNLRSSPSHMVAGAGVSMNRNTVNPLLSLNSANEKGFPEMSSIHVRNNVYNDSNTVQTQPYKIQISPGKIREASPSRHPITEQGLSPKNDADNGGVMFFRRTGILTYDHSPPRDAKPTAKSTIKSLAKNAKSSLPSTATPARDASGTPKSILRFQNNRIKSLQIQGTPRAQNSPQVVKSTPGQYVDTSPHAKSGSGLSGDDLGGLTVTPSKLAENDDAEYHPDDLAVIKAIEQADRYTPLAQNKTISHLKGNQGYKSTDRKQKQWERRYSQLQQMSYSPVGKS